MTLISKETEVTGWNSTDHLGSETINIKKLSRTIPEEKGQSHSSPLAWNEKVFSTQLWDTKPEQNLNFDT